MIILSPEGEKTAYELTTNTLSRAIDNKFYKISLEADNSIQKVHHLSHLNNEQFKLLAITMKSIGR